MTRVSLANTSTVTQRLIIRPLRESDARAVQSTLADYDVARRMAVVPYPLPEDYGHTFVEAYLSGRSQLAYAFAIETQDGWGRAVGFATLRNADPVLRLGYYLTPCLWGAGLASEAVGAVIGLFECSEDGVTIEAGVHTDNPASERVLEKCGFRYVADSMEPSVLDGGDKPARIYRRRVGAE